MLSFVNIKSKILLNFINILVYLFKNVSPYQFNLNFSDYLDTKLLQMYEFKFNNILKNIVNRI